MSPKDFSGEERDRIASLKTYLVNHLHQHLTIRELARRAALGEERFKEGFYKQHGKTIGAYIQQAKMETARFLIRHTGRSLKEIAGVCGYKNYKSFLKAYKNFFGLSAGRERKLR